MRGNFCAEVDCPLKTRETFALKSIVSYHISFLVNSLTDRDHE